MSSKMTRSEKERRQAVKENERAAKKKKKEASKSSSSSKIEKIAEKQFGKQEEEKKSLAERFAEATKNLNISRKTQRQEEKQKKIKVSEEKRYNPLTRTAVRTPEKDVSVGNLGRTKEELERRKSTREIAQMDADDWLKKSREQVALKDSEKAGVGLGTIQHGTLNKNAEYFTNNWSSIPGGYQVDAAIQMIYSNGVNNTNSSMIMSAFENASTYDKRKIMDAVVQTDGWTNVAYDMKRKINNAPDAEKALMQQISEDMGRENYLDTFKNAANKAIIDQNTLRQKEDKVIADWAKENYDLGEAMKYRTLETGASFVNNMSDAVSMGISDLLQAGQQERILDGINPFEDVQDSKGLGNKIAKFSTNVLHDLFRLAGINVSVLSKAMLSQEDVDKITEALLSIGDPYYEAVRNNMVAMENSKLSKAEKDAVEVYGMVIEQIPSIVMSLVASPAAGLATMGVTAGGKYARSAYEQGATLEQAVQFGLAGAAAEVATERMFTGFGFFGKGYASKLLNDTTRKMIDGSKFKNSVAADMLKRVVAGGGEATEEMIVEILTPYLERSTYDPTADGATLQEILRSGGLGFVVAQILGLPANALGVTDSVMRKMDTRRHEEMVLNQVEGEIADALARGEISETDAANINAQISDYRKGKGSLMDSQAKSETKVTGEDLGTVYANSNEAREAMAEEAKGKANGEKVTARFVENGKVRTWNGTVFEGKVNAYHEGITTQAENEKYAAKAQKVASATNAAERTGYQLNVKDEIVKEVSALSKAFNREVEFYYDENSAVHGNVDLNTGKIYVNVNSSQSPAAAVIAHEMTHLLENTSSYKTLTNMMQKYYASSLEDKRNEIIAIYKSDPNALKTILDKDDKIRMDVIDSEVMAAFIEEKLLTDFDSIRQIVREDRTLAQKIVDWLNKVIQKITGSKEQKFLIEARDVWNKALQEENSNKKAPEDGAEKRYSISRPLKESDLQEYLRAGKRRNKSKQEAIDRGEKIILTSDAEIRDYIDAAIHGNVNLPTVAYAKVNKNLADAVKNENKDFDIEDFYLEFVASDLYHAYETHKDAKEIGDIPLSENDFLNIPNLIENFEEILDAVKFKSGRSEVVLSSQTNSGKAIIVETVSLSRNSLLFKNMWSNTEDKFNNKYNKKRSAANSGGNQDGSTQSPRFANTSIDDIISDSSEKSNKRFSIGRSEDAAYMDAVNRGNMVEAQRMVDDAAKAAGYSNKMYHGAKGGGGFTVFRGWQYFTENKKYAERYADRNVPESLYSVYVKMEKPFDTRDDEAREIFYDMFNEYGLTELQEDGLPDWTDGYDITDYIEENDLDYDSVLLNEGGDPINGTISDGLGGGEFVSRGISYVIRDSAQIKSADPVTYDDDGNIIPLSQRFNEESDDIRWSIGKTTPKVNNELRDLIKAHNATMREVFHSRRRADHKELWDMIKEEVSHIIQTGAERRKVVDDIVRFAYETGYVNNAVETGETAENTWGRGIHIPEEYRGEMASLGGLRSINGQLSGSGLYFTYNRKKKGTDESYGGLDEAYSELQTANPMLPDTMDPAEQVEAIINLFGKTDSRKTLSELDEEAYAMGEESEPYLTDIRNAVETAMNDIATLARWNLMEDSRKRGVVQGVKRGKNAGASEQQKKQNRLDEATMREYDKLSKMRAEDERKEAEATMRMHDKLIEAVRKEEKALSRDEKREIQRGVREKKAEWDKELKKQASDYKKELRNADKNINSVLKEAERQRKKYESKLSSIEEKEMRKKQAEVDNQRRKERLRIAREEYKRNNPKPEEGSREALFFKNYDARRLAKEFRIETITKLVNMGQFVETNGEVVLDENGMEIAVRNADTNKWDASRVRNTYTPTWGLSLLAEKEGIDKDVFYTIYSKIADMRTKRDKNGNLVYKKKDIVDYIISLNLTAKQKEFLYFDAAKYAYIKRPVFLSGGRVNEKAGNKRGRMIEALDNIAMDMYSGVMSDEYFENAQIREEDITAFVDAVFGKEDSEKKNLFTADFLGMIEEYTTQMETARMAERTKLLTDKPKEKNSIKMQILRSYRESKRLFVAEGEAFERMGAKMKNPLLTARYYAAKKSSAIANEMIYGKTQRDFNGKKQGKSLYEIFKPVFRADEKSGNNKNMTELTELVNCRHDIYRLRNGKGYTGYSIEECERIVDRISKENPELLKVADEIVEYGRNLLKLCVYSGRISQQDYDYFTTKYPYYAPTFRLRSNEYIDRKGNVVRRDTKVIRTAVGGSDDVLPLFDQFVRRTQEIVKSCKKNQLASEMAKMIYNPHFGEYIKEVRLSDNQEEKELMLSSIGELEDIGRARKEDGMGNVIPWYANGKKYDIEVADEALLYGWDRITYRRNEYAIATAFRKLNNIRRGVLTQYNPTFFITNGIKDIQDMYLYNQHAQRLPKFHLEATKTMFAGTFGKGKNEEALEEYLSYGMSQASIFEYDNTNSGRRTKRDRVASVMRKPLDAFNALNFMAEQTPRLAVYNEAVDRLTNQRKKGGNTYSNEEIKTIAAYQASDATLNFGRSGTVIKEMNTYGFTFINAGVQGMDRFCRMFTQVKDGNKKALYINMLGLIIKMGIIGMGWNVLTDWIYGGDDEYAEAIRNALFDDPEKVMQEYSEMADYQRTNYLLIYINGTWIRVPKGRLASFIYGFEYNGVKVAEGEMDALDLVMAQFDLAAETILFSNPITNNILGPFVDIWRNKDAWGVDIVSEYDDMGEGFHYLESDEETTDLAVKIAEFGHKLTADLFGEEKARILDISPKKLDYLIEQYLGSYANVIMPFLNKEQNLKDNAIGALQSMIQKFYIDPTSSNRLAGDYYDLKEEYENIANAYENDSPYAVAAKVFADYTKPLKALREEINAIDADNSLTRKEKLEKISALREEMNELYRQGISDAESALSYAKENYYGADENSETYEQWEQLTKGAEWQISTMSDSAQEKWKGAEEEGIDADSFVSAYNFIKNATGDKDENGKTIPGSKKAKVVKHINSLPITAEQKLYLYFDLGGYSENGDIPAFSNGSVGSGVSANMASPISGGGTITSKYGYRNTGIPGASNYHQAVDIAAPQGTDVGATMSGTVTKVTSSGGYGNSVEITSKDEDGNTIVTKYSHLSNFGVEVGDVIAQGKKIGEVGSTGVSSGAHLDFKLSINGEWVDPLLYVDLAGAGIVDAVGYTQKEGAVSSGYSGGSSSQTSRKTATTAERKSTNYDSVAKLGSSSGTSGGRVVLPTASEYAAIQARNVSGRSTKSATYGAKGTYLPKASDYSPQKRSIGTSVATTQRTGRTGGSLWDENVLS